MMTEKNGRTITLLCYGHRRGIRIDQFAGPWVSIGIHIHGWPLAEAHLTFHLGWWLVTIGRHYGG